MENARVSPLHAHVGFWLRFVSNHVSLAFEQQLRERDISIAEWVVLREVYEAEVAPSDLASRIGMTRGAVSKIADKLVAKTLLRRSDSKTDRRFHTLAPTARGRSLVPILAGLADRNDEDFFGWLDQAERDEIIATMREIVRRCGLTTTPVD